MPSGVYVRTKTIWNKDRKLSDQLCGKYQIELKEKVAIHHINYDKKNLDPKNLISLCRSCHTKTNHNRENWIKLFWEKACQI